MKNTYVTPTEKELFRFFLAGKKFEERTNDKAFMPSCIVDIAWHNLLKEKERYAHLTILATNSKVEHLENKGSGEINWVSDYESLFGKLSQVWFTSTEGILNHSAYSEYLKIGKMYASWDCTPGYKPIEEINDENQSEKSIFINKLVS
jgi:hypothetical protein